MRRRGSSSIVASVEERILATRIPFQSIIVPNRYFLWLSIVSCPVPQVTVRYRKSALWRYGTALLSQVFCRLRYDSGRRPHGVVRYRTARYVPRGFPYRYRSLMPIPATNKQLVLVKQDSEPVPIHICNLWIVLVAQYQSIWWVLASGQPSSQWWLVRNEDIMKWTEWHHPTDPVGLDSNKDFLFLLTATVAINISCVSRIHQNSIHIPSLWWHAGQQICTVG
jgi:hypothetical protein